MIINMQSAGGSGSSPTLQTKSVSYTPTTSAQSDNVTADAGYDGLAAVNVSVDPISPEKAAATYYPNTSDQSVASGQWLTGAQVFKGVVLTNLTAANIKSGVIVEVGDAQKSNRIAEITGTYVAASKNAQVVQQNNTRIASSSYIKACGDLTVSKTGTYDVYWTAYRTSTSGNWGSQLYIGSSAYGSAQTAFNSYFQTVHLSNVSLTANQILSVYGRTRGSNYYLYVGQLTIIEA